RAAERGRLDRFEQEGRVVLDAVLTSYLARAKADPALYRLVDAAQTLANVQASLDTLLTLLLALLLG
ncbi:dTMP kinase, partial [Pseudomonas syringae pv. tagetis]